MMMPRGGLRGVGGYDGEGNTVDVYFPVSPEKLKWKYFKTKAIW